MQIISKSAENGRKPGPELARIASPASEGPYYVCCLSRVWGQSRACSCCVPHLGLRRSAALCCHVVGRMSGVKRYCFAVLQRVCHLTSVFLASFTDMRGLEGVLYLTDEPSFWQTPGGVRRYKTITGPAR